MSGVDINTGRPLAGWAHVEQSLGVIFTTRFGERIMREWFGSFVPQMLGENLKPSTIVRFVQAVVVAVELWEPRFKIRRCYVEGSPEQLRSGKLFFVMIGDYRPRALLGDFRIESAKELRRPLFPALT